MLLSRLALPCAFLAITSLLSGCVATAVVGGTAAASSTAFDERSAGSHFDDIALSGKIRARLFAEKNLPARWVSVEVIDRRAVLTGYLPQREQITRALRITQQTEGVESAQSKIKVGAPKASELLSDTWITTKVKTKLFDDPLTSGFSAHVETVSGVSGVVNMLHITP